MDGLPLTQLWPILRRHWKLLIFLPAITLALSDYASRKHPPPQIWEVGLAYALEVPASAAVPGSEEGSRAEVAADAVDDLARILGRDVFAEKLSQRLPKGSAMEAGELVAALSTEDQHRILELRIRRALPGDARVAERKALQATLAEIATAIMAEIEEDGAEWLGYLGEEGARLSLIDRPDPAALVPPSLRTRLELPLRVGLAALLALGFAFFLEAIDPRLRLESEVEALCRTSILGRIPRA
jgi:capsular polysaccharide biosynthesis protein